MSDGNMLRNQSEQTPKQNNLPLLKHSLASNTSNQVPQPPMFPPDDSASSSAKIAAWNADFAKQRALNGREHPSVHTQNTAPTSVVPNSSVSTYVGRKEERESTPRSGIEFPFMKKRPMFKGTSNNFERISSIRNAIIDDPYSDSSKRNAKTFSSEEKTRIVYDCIEGSPFYEQNPYDDGDFRASRVLSTSSADLLGLNGTAVGNGMNSNYQRIGGRVNTNISGNASTRKDRFFDKLKPYYPLQQNGEEDLTLVFESRFESGNLRRAVQTGPLEYELILKPDYNTTGYTQWFYFRVGNTRRFKTYKFSIINYVKPESLYNEGMKMLMYSKKDSEENGIGWFRGGKDILYYQNCLRKKNSANYYTLTFTVEFQHDHDEVYFAHCYPYTYSDVSNLINRVCTIPNKDRVRKTLLCKTLAGNDCEMLIITNFYSDPEDIARRKSVIISGRVHPGESNSSYIVQGIIEFLVSNDMCAKRLRNTYVFKIIPMLNPDGVIIGNYRCSLTG